MFARSLLNARFAANVRKPKRTISGGSSLAKPIVQKDRIGNERSLANVRCN
ncbi:hypothetical protein DPMN_078481 [Dreissena polymorpha]|uniref:Uncharacterized protein n=1 Tax=Dreissena polymorpha TaxID=45954 RepID=A0A9D3YR72_DREPO|nr:hypothetical protein DPMN_078481 [Dreissena polymorpha]